MVLEIYVWREFKVVEGDDYENGKIIYGFNEVSWKV